jgi:hypothetical protein
MIQVKLKYFNYNYICIIFKFEKKNLTKYEDDRNSSRR